MTIAELAQYLIDTFGPGQRVLRASVDVAKDEERLQDAETDPELQKQITGLALTPKE